MKEVTYELVMPMSKDYGVWEVDVKGNGQNWVSVADVMKGNSTLVSSSRLRFRLTQPWFGIVNIPFYIKG